MQNPGASNIRGPFLKVKMQVRVTAWIGPWMGTEAFRRQVNPVLVDPERKELEGQIPRPHFPPVLQILCQWIDTTGN